MERISDLPSDGQYRMILYLAGWFSHLDLTEDQDATQSILHTLILLTSYHIEKRSDLLSKLWTCLAFTQNNVEFILEVLLATILETVCLCDIFLQ